MLLKTAKLIAVAFSVFLAVAGLSIFWFVRLARIAQVESGAISVALDKTMITHSPMYWLIVAVILAIAVIGCRQWVFV